MTFSKCLRGALGGAKSFFSKPFWDRRQSQLTKIFLGRLKKPIAVLLKDLCGLIFFFLSNGCVRGFL